MSKLKDYYPVIEWIKTIPIKIIGFIIVNLIFITGLTANAATISGTVTDADTSAAIGGVTIIVNNGMTTTTTDGSGYYEISGLSAGCYEINANPGPGDVNHIFSGRRYTSVGASDTATIDFVLETGAITLSGNVQAGGSGLNNIGINYHNDPLENGQRTYTDSNGNYILYNLPPGKGRLEVSPWGTGWASTGRNVDLADSPPNENFNLVPGACISGRVVDENGDGVADVLVRYYSDFYATRVQNNTDANGDFNICSLPPGIGGVKAQPQTGTGFCNSTNRMIFLSQGQNKDIGRMTVHRGALVDGTVEDPSGSSFTGLEVESEGVNFDSDSDICNGSYELRLPEGTHEIHLSPPGDGPYAYVADPVEVTITAGDITSGLPINVPQEMTVYSADDPESATLTGEVVDNANPDPTGTFSIAVFSAGVLDNLNFEDMPGIRDIQGIVLDGFGSFILDPVPPGSFDVVLFLNNETPDGLDSITLLGKQSVTVSEGDSTTLSDFVYSAQGSPQVSGSVKDINGNPVLGAHVVITDQSTGNFAAMAETDENGQYMIYNLPAGSYDVQAGHPDYSDMPATTIISTDGNITAVSQLTFTSPIPIYDLPLDWGSVMNVHQSDGSLATYLEIAISSNFNGTLPDNIDSITVDGPSGTVATYPGPGWSYYPNWRSFFIKLPGSPETGTYTFTVIGNGGKSVGTISDTQTENKTIDIPDNPTFTQAAGGTLSSKDSTFFWNSVTPPPSTTLYYRLDIVEDDSGDPGNYVYYTNPVQNMLSYTVPNGVLNPGQSYLARVRAYDAISILDIQNRSNSDWVPFTVERDPKRLQFFAVTVYGSELNAEFDVLPGFTNKLVSAVLNLPNPSRSDYSFDPANDKLVWDTECRYVDEWDKSFGAVQAGDYGPYTLTLNFSDGAQEVYTDTLQEVIPTLPAVTISDVDVNDDGGIHVTWDRNTTGDYYYQVRVRDSSNKEYCRVGSFFNASEANLSAWDLRCLKKGETYRLLVRVYDLNSNAAVTTEVSGPYDPLSLTHSSIYGVWDWRGELALGFKTRPGSRDQVDSVIVTGPNSFQYNFDLIGDWDPLSTETRLDMDMWWHQDPLPITPGNYTFTIDFDEDGDQIVDKTEQYTRSLNVTSVAQVDSSTMSADIKPTGAIDFSWSLPVPTGQMYYVSIRNIETPANSVKEYYRSSNLYDINHMTASFWDLRGLEHGQTYQWFVRSTVSGYNSLKQSESKTFVYNPFDAEGDGLFDLWDPDDDNDGLSDVAEVTYGTNPLNPDYDGDGLSDGAEVNIYHTDPLSVTTGIDTDTDGDGLSDIEESAVYLTDPGIPDSDGDGYNDGVDAFPNNENEWADSDGDGIGDNADNCPNDYNPNQENFDQGLPGGDLKGNVCDQDADADGYISPLFPNGNDCNDLDPDVHPGDGTCMAEGLKPRPPAIVIPDADGDGVSDTEDNCPSSANSDQLNSDEDDYGDVCDTCPNLSNPDQKVPVWYKDLDGDGYSDGKTLAHCDPPAGYKDASALIGLGDCDDANKFINPSATEVLNNGLDDDCNPETADVVPAYRIVHEMVGRNYSDWMPVNGETVVISFKVIDADGNEVSNPGVTSSVAQVSSHSGKYTNDPGTAGDDFEYASVPNQGTLTSRDFGGSITIHAEVTISVQGAPLTLQRDITFPKDTDQDGIAEAWESQYGNLDPAADIDGDGLTNFEEYRGVLWGKLNKVGPNSVYQTVAYIPENLVTHIRTDPTRRDLFVKFTGFDAAHPFAIGDAYRTEGIDVHALNAGVVTTQSLSDDYNIDVVTVALADNTFGLETGHIIKRGVMDYTFATLGLSSFGNIEAYGPNCTIYKYAIDYYFKDRPYVDYSTFDGTNMRDQNAWGPKNGILDIMPNIEDKDDDGITDGGEDKSGNGVLDGDHVVRAAPGSADPWEFNHDLSPFNVNNDPAPLVELPVGDVNYEYTKAQVLKHVITHEIGHNVGVDIHTEDPMCVMYKYSSDWLRDDHFSDAARNLIMIHNQ